ncbi:hnRNP A1-gamma isoform [Pisolithus tinctorius]|nr:hnRNP A1-gamma isoform [Pisolithus tinctorius]
MATEKKDNADSDLYGDLYDDGFTIPLDDDDEASNEPFELMLPEDDQTLSESSTKPQSTDSASLPAKPSSTSDSASLSYSAQVAKQFSAYHQTPSQERQQRPALPVPVPVSAPGPSAIATHETDRSRTDRPIRPSEMKDEGKMFIGGLSWDTTDEGLKKYFSQFGKVDACTIMRDPDGRSRGFAFLTFEEPESVNAVLAREHTLDGKTIDPKRAIPREEHLRNTRYFVGGLSHATTADSMRDFFSAYGKVVDATVMVDRETGRSKGFGFVTFEDSSNQERFVGKLGLVLDDKEIEVKMAQPRSQRDQARNATGRDGYGDQEARNSAVTPMTFNPQQAANPAASMMYQRMMNQIPMANGGAGSVGMINPMMMGMGMGGMNMGATGMGMGMNSFGAMGLGGMGMMGGGVNPMMAMNPMGMRMGMGAPMAMGMMQPSAAGGMGMANVGMRMRQGMGMGMENMMGMNGNAGAMSMSSGPGPSRMPNRVRHTFHPYAR